MTKYSVTALLCLAVSSLAMAGTLSNLQQQANRSYEQMKQSERDVSQAKKEVEVKEGRLRYFREKFVEAERELQTAQQAFQEAEKNMVTTKKRWGDYSEELYQKWHQKE